MSADVLIPSSARGAVSVGFRRTIESDSASSTTPELSAIRAGSPPSSSIRLAIWPVMNLFCEATHSIAIFAIEPFRSPGNFLAPKSMILSTWWRIFPRLLPTTPVGRSSAFDAPRPPHPVRSAWVPASENMNSQIPSGVVRPGWLVLTASANASPSSAMSTGPNVGGTTS